MKKNLAVLIMIISLSGIAVYQNFSKADTKVLPAEQAPKIDFLAPHFQLEALDEQSYEVSGAREKVLFINFWASWCEPCKMEAPELVKLHELYKDELDIYAVNVTSDGDSVEEAADFAENYGYSFPVLLDLKGEVSKLYNIYGYPTSFIVSRDGVIKDVIYGILPPEDLEKRVKKVLRS